MHFIQHHLRGAQGQGSVEKVPLEPTLSCTRVMRYVRFFFLLLFPALLPLSNIYWKDDPLRADKWNKSVMYNLLGISTPVSVAVVVWHKDKPHMLSGGRRLWLLHY